MSIVLESGPARCEIDPDLGGRISSLEVGGLHLLVGKDADPMRWGSYPMAPWAGRLGNGRFQFGDITHQLPLTLPPHAIHGTAYQRAWRDDGGGCLSIDLGADWPFAGRAVQQIALDDEQLSLQLEVHSEGDPFPASLGWHPWFLRELARGDPVELEFNARTMYERNADHLPSGALVPPREGPRDDCYKDVIGVPTLRWPGALTLELTATCDHWVVYDEPQHAICVEPMTGPPDALNLAPHIVAPERPLSATMQLRWHLDSA